MKRRTRRWGTIVAALLVGLAALHGAANVPAASAQAQPEACHFVRGFADLRERAGAAVVGDCLENERSTINGDVQQATTGGLLVWRKIDNFTAFTDGFQSWIAGPTGLVSRLNSQRFPFEGDRLAIEALQRGGLVVYFRHGATDTNQDTDPSNLANCATQRNLSERGRDQARVVGDAFRRLRVPVGRVLSSEYCRAREFAEIGFGRAETMQTLNYLPDPQEPLREPNAAALRTLLTTPPPARVNTIIAAHQPNLIDAMGINPSVEGEAVLFQSDGQGGAVMVARFVPDEWVTLAQILAGR